MRMKVGELIQSLPEEEIAELVGIDLKPNGKRRLPLLDLITHLLTESQKGF